MSVKIWYIKNNFPSNPWYDKECKSLKQVLNNIAKDKKFNTRQSEYNIMLRQYKQLIQKKKRHYQEVKLSQLENENRRSKFLLEILEIFKT